MAEDYLLRQLQFDDFIDANIDREDYGELLELFANKWPSLTIAECKKYIDNPDLLKE